MTIDEAGDFILCIFGITKNEKEDREDAYRSNDQQKRTEEILRLNERARDKKGKLLWLLYNSNIQVRIFFFPRARSVFPRRP